MLLYVSEPNFFQEYNVIVQANTVNPTTAGIANIRGSAYKLSIAIKMLSTVTTIISPNLLNDISIVINVI